MEGVFKARRSPSPLSSCKESVKLTNEVLFITNASVFNYTVDGNEWGGLDAFNDLRLRLNPRVVVSVDLNDGDVLKDGLETGGHDRGAMLFPNKKHEFGVTILWRLGNPKAEKWAQKFPINWYANWHGPVIYTFSFSMIKYWSQNDIKKGVEKGHLTPKCLNY